uniref:Cytochrome P450 n=1 Tax=Kalanchoe fedtschenkoi TaxID=63787 RepID=A0A7N0UZR1_KALFE
MEAIRYHLGVEMWYAVGVGVLTLLTVWIAHRWRNPKAKHVNLPPGSMGLPLIGETFQLITPGYSLDLHPFIKSRLQRYGAVFKTSVAAQPVVISADPDMNNHIMLQEGKSVEMRYMDTYSKMFNLDGESRINAAGFIHKYYRGKTLAHFGSQSLQEKLLPLIEVAVQKALNSWSEKESIEVKNETSAMVFEFTARQIFGYDPEESSVKLSDKFSNFLGCLMTLPLNFPGTKYYNCMKDHKYIMNMLKQVVKDRLAVPKTQEESGDFLDSAIKDIGTEKLVTEEFVVYLLFALLVASYDSVSLTLAVAFKLLSEHPSVLEELTAEHDAIVNSRIDKDSSLTWEEYKSMTFTRQVINETLRIGPIAPGLLRRTLQDIEVKGYKIPAGWTVMVVTAAQQYNPEAFEEPDKFNPSRWKELDSSIISKNFMPFGGGTRQCAGAEYSKAFMAVFFHKLLTQYRWTKVRGGDIIRNPLLGFKDGIHIKVSVKH